MDHKDDIKRLNIGCGREIKEGYVNLDRVELDGVDVVHDLEKFPYPFDDNEFDEIYCKHVLEHIENFMEIMEELYRISKPEARMKIISPYFSGQGAYNDPTHKRFFTWKTFEYFSSTGYYSKSIFKIIKRRIFFFSSKRFMKSKFYSLPFDFLINLLPMIYQRYFCWIFPASEIHYLLEVKK